MPYIETQKVKAMRENIRKALPDYKVSVTKHHNSTVSVHLMEGPIEPVDVNVYWYKEHLKENPKALAVVERVLSEIHKVKEPRELVYDGDYGSVPTFYIDVTFGRWDKPYLKTS